MKVGVMGAGAIGCYLGGRLLASGVPAVLGSRRRSAARRP
jgi:ketopantoate reductase